MAFSPVSRWAIWAGRGWGLQRGLLVGKPCIGRWTLYGRKGYKRGSQLDRTVGKVGGQLFWEWVTMGAISGVAL